VYAGLDWVDAALAKRSMQLMAEEVMPRVNAAIKTSTKLDDAIARDIADADAGRAHPVHEVFGDLRERIQQKGSTRGG
jgi:predicted transcriptional regulator